MAGNRVDAEASVSFVDVSHRAWLLRCPRCSTEVIIPSCLGVAIMQVVALCLLLVATLTSPSAVWKLAAALQRPLSLQQAPAAGRDC